MYRTFISTAVFALAWWSSGLCKATAVEMPLAEPVVIVELFTSEGCSSCPPADEVLAGLTRGNAVKGVRIVPLGLHVDYWNRLGWSDPFSSAQFSERQQHYAQMFNSNEVYTPQMIVDGTQQFVGSDRGRAIAAIKKSAAQIKGTLAVQIATDLKDENSRICKIQVNGVPRNGAQAVDVMLAITEDDLCSDVPRGENAGRILHHASVVRAFQRVATINPADVFPFAASTTIRLQPTWQVEHLHVVVFVQDPISGKIVAGDEREIAKNAKQH